MIIKEVISMLRHDTELSRLLGGNHIYTTPSTYLGNSIVYSWNAVNSDKIKTTDRLEIHIIADTLKLCAELESRIKQLLLSFGDEPLTANVLEVVLNGGGYLFDEERQKHHKILYFYILSKE